MPPPTPPTRAPMATPIARIPTNELFSSTPVSEAMRNTEERKDRTSLPRWSKASLTFEDGEVLKSVDCSLEHKDLFENDAVVHKQEKRKAVAEYKVHVAEYQAFLESCNFIKETTQWKDVQECLEDEKHCSRLEYIDRMAIFQEYVRHLEREVVKQRQTKKLLKKDEEIQILRARVLEVEALHEKLQQNLEEAQEMLRRHAFTDKGTIDESNEAHHSGSEAGGQEKKRPHKRSGGRSRMASRVRRCHDIIVCKNEAGALQILKLLKDSDYKILHEVDVPGIIPDPYDKDKRKKKIWSLSPFGKILFLGMIDDLYRLHRAGLSLDGKFKLEDFYWLRNRKVKLSADLKHCMLRRSPKRMNQDYKNLCKLMRLLLEKYGAKIPTDLEFLLSLMNSDNPMMEQMLIRYNICLMDEISKGTYTLTLYRRLEQLDAEDSVKFGPKNRESYRSETVYDYIIPADEDWSNVMCENEFTKSVFEKWGTDTGYRPPYKPRHLVELLRHCIVHLPKLAYRNGIIHFTDANVPSIMELISPGVFSQFQAGMYVIKQIAYPHLMNVMRV